MEDSGKRVADSGKPEDRVGPGQARFQLVRRTGLAVVEKFPLIPPQPNLSPPNLRLLADGG
jgi:hypothetical protein